MTGKRTRRDFLCKLVSGLAGLSLLSPHDESTSAHAASARYKLGQWTGDDFTLGHQLRDGKSSKLPKLAEKSVDFVIIGGGLAGLSCAQYLKDHEFLLLEQYDQLGGHARGGTYNGIDYSLGAAYYTDNEGDLGKLVAELDLHPVELSDNKNAWLWNQQWISGTTGSTSNLYKEFDRFKADNKSFWDTWNGLADKELFDNASLMKLDKETFESYLKSYDPNFAKLIDNYLLSSLCDGASKVSALSALASIEDIFIPTYVLPGGNAAISKALSNRLKQSHPDAIQSGAFVWSVELKQDGASVIYSKGKQLSRVDCKHVIIAIPHMITSRITEGLPDKVRSTMFRFRYGSYLVANLLLRKPLLSESYDNWLPNPHSIADIVVAETPYRKSGSSANNNSSVLTLYVPYGAGTSGRTILFEGNRKKIAGQLIEELQPLLPELQGQLDEIALTRWGHAMAVTRTGYFELLSTLSTYESDSFSFAHSSAHGLPCIESAVAGGRHAANRALQSKNKTKASYSISR